jgi:hypothetical protein
MPEALGKLAAKQTLREKPHIPLRKLNLLRPIAVY